MAKYSVNDMLEVAKQRYGANLNYNRLARIIKRMGYWDHGEEVIIGKKKTKVFESRVMEKAFMSPRLYNELHKNDPDFKSYKELEKEAEIQRNSELEYLDSLFEDKHKDDVDYQYIKKKIFEIKINAIFEAFYTPFDVERFTEDISLDYTVSNPYDIDPQIVAARNRLDHPENNYYKRKE